MPHVFAGQGQQADPADPKRVDLMAPIMATTAVISIFAWLFLVIYLFSGAKKLPGGGATIIEHVGRVQGVTHTSGYEWATKKNKYGR